MARFNPLLQLGVSEDWEVCCSPDAACLLGVSDISAANEMIH